MDENELTQIENDLLSHEQYYKFHLLGTFQIIHPHGTREMWENFKSCNLALALKTILPQRPIKICFIICRRHPELTHFFLDYFDNAKQNRIEFKDYIYFIMFRVEYIPVQWIVYHITNLSDLRYASHLVTATFSWSLRHNAKCIDKLYMNNLTWREFIKEHQKLTFENASSAWKKLLYLRSAIGEIINFRMPIKLMEFTRLDKKDYVRMLISKTSTASELRKILKTTILPFCDVHSIDIASYIVTIISKKDWNVQDKLSFVAEHVKNAKDKKKALESMTIYSEKELDKLRDFAKKFSINFIPVPKNIVKRKPQSTSGFIMRSSSIGEIPRNPTKLRPGTSLDSFKRSPSIDLSQIDNFDEESSLSSIANGEPYDDPIEYANKLRRLRNMKEIKPIYDLAEKFGIVVSYDEIKIIWGKRQLFDRLLSQIEPSQFDEICSTLQLSNNEVIDIVCGSVDYVYYADGIYDKLSKYVNQSTIMFYFEYLQNYAHQMITKDPIFLILKVYKYGLEIALKYSPGKDLLFYSIPLHFVNQIIESDCSDADKTNHFMAIINNDLKQMYQIFPQDTSIWEKDQFINNFLSIDPNRLADSIAFIATIEDQKIKKDYLKTVFPSIDGYKYSLLQFILISLNGIDPIYRDDIEILNILHSSLHQTIDYHKLKQNPKGVLESAITVENIFEILPLTEFFKISKDDLLLDLMLHKMKSLKFEDYKPLLNRLQNSSSSSCAPKILQLMKRFSMNDQIELLNALGLFDIRKTKQTMVDLMRLGLGSYFNNIYMRDPEKLLKVLYSKIELHEKLGNRLHIFAKKLSTRFDLDLIEIQGKLIKLFLTEDESQIEKEDDMSKSSSVSNQHQFHQQQQQQQQQTHHVKHADLFELTVEPQNLQRALFILRDWDNQKAISWLDAFVSDKKNTWLSRSLAVQCWITISDAKIPETIKPADFYFNSMLEEIHIPVPSHLSSEYLFEKLQTLNKEYKESVGDDDNDDSSDEKNKDPHIKEMKNQLHGIAKTLLGFIICNKVDNIDMICESLRILLIFDPLFIILNIIPLFYAIPSTLRNDEIFEMFVESVSIPIDMIITKKVRWQPNKSQHTSVMRNVLNLLSLTPKPINYLIVNKKKVGWGQLAEMLCKVGCVALAAELGSHLISIKDRNEVLNHLMNGFHFDDALKNGFDRQKIFKFIVNGNIEQATETLIDSHFIAFTNWLKEQNDIESINKVEETLCKQGRTVEAKRMKERLAKL
ncbi:hypothetical protein M9Y10_038979 [Tritrichomonas musculus]|uniref:Uncharacterized protein n=1 Tax=Tritrichomonas musculus TaxID=1915356 RepID=A0ABR2K9Y2_9EUKA